MSEQPGIEWECRYVDRNGWLALMAEGWQIKELALPHGRYSVLAVREARPER